MTDATSGFNIVYCPKCKRIDFWLFFVLTLITCLKPSTIQAIFLLLDEVLAFLVSVQGDVPQAQVRPIDYVMATGSFWFDVIYLLQTQLLREY